MIASLTYYFNPVANYILDRNFGADDICKTDKKYVCIVMNYNKTSQLSNLVKLFLNQHI